jgi:hypothetical protein
MSRRGRRCFWAAVVALPLLFVALWAWSGRERLTKSAKPVMVDVVDVFGDHTPETRLVPGPVFGHYIGLDLVGAVVLACAGVAAIGYVVERRGRFAARPLRTDHEA